MWRQNRFMRTMIDKEESDRALLTTSKDVWYAVNFSILEPRVRATFHPSHYDQDTDSFINSSIIISNSICLQFYYAMFSMFLSRIMSKTSMNGLLNRGEMYIFSRSQIKNFLGLPDDWSPTDKKLLDIGAGDGGVTKVLNEFYSMVSVVEASKVMEWRLAQHGFTVLELNKWKHSGPYHLVSALNLLDRHHNPVQLLADLHLLATESNCLALLGLVLPYRPYVEFNPESRSTQPVTTIAVRGTMFEDHVNALVQHTFQQAGFEVVRWTKLPYLSEGDLAKAYYQLDDAIFLLRPIRKPQSSYGAENSPVASSAEATRINFDEL